MSLIFVLLYLILMLFQLALIVRIVFEIVQAFARRWRPRGIALVAASAVYSVTDPPMKALRRLIPPLRIGGFALDLAFLVLFLAVTIAMAIVAGLA